MHHNPFYGQSLLKLIDYRAEDIQLLLTIAARLKQQKQVGNEDKYLIGKSIALIFEKDSTRTRIAFEVAAADQGAFTSYLASGTQIGHKESIKDTARVLANAYDGIQYRGFAQENVQTLADFAGVPVYNGLTNEFHPTQGLADLLTMMENSDKSLAQIAYCFVGDCRFNMANTLLLAGALMGMDVRLLCPDSLRPDAVIVDKAQQLAQQSGARITITDDHNSALNGCDFVHTDVWVSMGEDSAVWKERIDLLKSYQVNTDLMAKTHNPNAKFMHCLPAFHNRDTVVGEQIYQQYGLDGLEVSDAVFESPQSIVFQQADNRLHTIKAVLVTTLVENLDFIL